MADATEIREISSIGFVGWGRMGTMMGHHLLRRGWPVCATDPAPEAQSHMEEVGVARLGDAAAVAAASDLVFLVVIDDAQVFDVVTGPGGALETARPGTVLAVCASVRPDTCEKLAAIGLERGVHVIDVALVGGGRAADNATLKLMCGGPAEVISACHAAFSTMATDICHVGGVGAGQVAKTANNILLWSCIRADYEALKLAKALGVEPGRLRAFLSIGSGANRPLAEWGSPTLRWTKKDLEVALAIADEVGVDMPLIKELAPLMDQLTVDDLQSLR